VRLLRKPHPLAMSLTWLLVVFLVLFPKGGIKAGELPLTWGYAILALSVPPLLLVRLLAVPLRLSRSVLLALAMLAPMQVLFVYAIVFCGVEDASFAVSTFVALFALPWIFLLVYAPLLRWVDGERLSRYLRWSILLAALWGILLFFLHPLTGHFLEVPYLTVNAADYGEIEATKHIARGLFLKLISTYNNGNVYGVATLILLPMYRRLEPVRWRRATVMIALLLTLSRTVWIGLVLLEIFPLLSLAVRQVGTFPVLRLRGAMRRVALVVVTVALIFGAVLFNSASGGVIAFLFDPTAGGRIGEITAVVSNRITLLPSQPVSAFLEILYSSAAQGYGWAGLAAFVLIMVSPLLLLPANRSALRSPLRRAALEGLVVYMIVAASDGALNYIPVMAFYWFAYMIYLCGWPQVLAQRVSQERSRRTNENSAASPDFALPLPAEPAGG
jgi:hypothetical protein